MDFSYFEKDLQVFTDEEGIYKAISGTKTFAMQEKTYQYQQAIKFKKRKEEIILKDRNHKKIPPPKLVLKSPKSLIKRNLRVRECPVVPNPNCAKADIVHYVNIEKDMAEELKKYSMEATGIEKFRFSNKNKGVKLEKFQNRDTLRKRSTFGLSEKE